MRYILTVLAVMIVSTSCSQSLTPTLEEKIAKMLIVGVDGTSLNIDGQTASDVRDKKVGGVILFERNITPVGPKNNSIEKLAKLSSDLQNLRKDKIIISIDQEGGKVTRLKSKYGFPNFVSAKYLGDLDNIDSTKYYADLTASWLQKLNINTNFAPCVDLIANENCPVISKLNRSFSKDEMEVFEHASQVIKSHKDKGVYTAVKHFPGHGSSTIDSHLGFTDVSETWNEKELIPFAEIVKNGDVSMIMVAHVFNSKFDDKYPASLSEKTINGLLRRELGWQGVVVTDDMLMKAIVDNFDYEHSIELAINAGCDLFIYSANISKTKEPASVFFIRIVKKLISEGKVTEKRIDESYNRINNLLNN